VKSDHRKQTGSDSVRCLMKVKVNHYYVNFDRIYSRDEQKHHQEDETDSIADSE
jgi:hypothetical protein